MPYIPQNQRHIWTEIDAEMPQGAGELNFFITCLLRRYIDCSGGLRYAVLNEIIGVLECVKLELYRRVAAPYEDQKCKENGDVYE